MKVLYYLLFLYFLVIHTAKSQVAEWINIDDALTSAVTIDYFGNSFSCGQFVGTTIIGGNSYTSAGVQDVAIAKRNPSGQTLWVTAFGGTQGDYAYDISFDGIGNVWVVGVFSGTINIGSYSLTSAGGNDVFIVKLDASNGNILFASRCGGTGADSGLSLRTSNSGDVFISGIFISNFSYGSFTMTGPSYEVYILKLNHDGTFLWADKISGSAIESMWSMDIDDSENVYISGFSTSGTVDFAGSSVNLNGNNHFTVKFNNQGQYVWSALSSYNGEIMGTKVDNSGNVYFTGNFDTQATFGPIQLTGLGNDDILLGKINNLGDFEWVQNIGGTGSDQGYGITCSDNGDVFLAGSFIGSFTFGTTNVSAGSNSKGYLAKINPNGTVNWVVQSTGNSNTKIFKYVAIDSWGTIYVVGTGGGLLNFGGQSSNPTSCYLIKVINDANIIYGTVFSDENNDGIWDTSEQGVPNVILTANNNPLINAVANNFGDYEMYTGAGNYNVGIPNIPLYYSLTTSSSIPVSFTGMGSTAFGNNFGLHPIANMNDLRIDITNITNPKAGYVLAYQITYKNVGTTTINASINLAFDPLLMFLNAAPNASGQTGQTLSWNLGTLAPQMTSTIHVNFNVPVNAVLGYPVNATATILPATGDNVPQDNTSNLVNLVVGPYDPNYKEVNIDTLWDVSVPGFLNYTIHFQNIGNDVADMVMLLDTLSSYLDLTSMEIIAQSHEPMDWRFINGNIAEFRFDNIMLPDSASDPIGSCGFVKFKVKYLSNLPLYESIFNFADIYFDYNPPIRTNTSSTIYFKNSTQVAELASTNFSIYPSPAIDEIFIQPNTLKVGKYQIQIMDLNGKIVLSKFVDLFHHTIQFDVSGLAPGMYFVELKNDNITERKKMLKN